MQLPPCYAIRGESLEMIFGNRRERWRPGGPEPGAWWQTPGTGWERFEPAFHLPTAERISCRPVNLAERGWQSAYQFLLGHWSEEVRALIRPLPGGHWRLLERPRDPAFRDLLDSHRPLAAFLSQSVADEKEFVGLVARRRREIVAALGLPGTDAVVRLLSRVSAEDLTSEMLEQLRAAFRGEAEVVRRLTHLPRLNLPLLRILTTPEYRRVFQFEALVQVGRAPTEPAADSLFPRLEQTRESSGRVRAIRRLEDLDRQWSSSRRPITEMRPRELPREFPAPPLPESETIRAIRTQRELREEGRRMHHCCGGYAAGVRRGGLYFYQVLAPERATLAIAARDGRWCIREMKAACNRAVMPATVRAVAAWLEAAQNQR